MKIAIRPARPADHHACEALVRDAFWDLYRPGCVEHLILRQARTSSELVFDLVGAADQELLGCLLATRARVVGASDSDVLYLGPLAVRGDRQRRGVGSQLVSSCLSQAADLGFVAAFLYGDPSYYERFGFANAAQWGVTTRDGLNFDAFMGIELQPGGLAGITGRLVESDVFDVDPQALIEFDAGFPPRETHVLPGQFTS